MFGTRKFTAIQELPSASQQQRPCLTPPKVGLEVTQEGLPAGRTHFLSLGQPFFELVAFGKVVKETVVAL